MADENEPHRVILIAGVTGGIGSDLAARCAEAGWEVAGFSRSAENLEALREKIPELTCFEANACESNAVQGVVDKVMEKFGRVDAYVHCVGSFLLKPAHSCSDEEFGETLMLNLNSAFFGLRAVVRPMMKGDGGAITLISSVAAMAGMPSHEAIAAAKGGINGLVRSAASTYANKGIRVNAVAPGMVESNLSKPLLGSEQSRNMAISMHPLVSFLRPAGDLLWFRGCRVDTMTRPIVILMTMRLSGCVSQWRWGR
ncbi:SDR family NAD(P)-dependent oxidoreductase [Puniceicoccus vermicola]|uniref:SDR family oxidoreductase n=1 Tax=Puniceicoccus vermicola TaxID=388746 RepID=A0A7X1AYA5_9BACT|nr:SDR family oxidoreductase [Puniceicoccus vermicola]MBC2602228.1 SDR family oxidoreductase [Puniceicoccus vermicola]